MLCLLGHCCRLFCCLMRENSILSAFSGNAFFFLSLAVRKWSIATTSQPEESPSASVNYENRRCRQNLIPRKGYQYPETSGTLYIDGRSISFISTLTKRTLPPDAASLYLTKDQNDSRLTYLGSPITIIYAFRPCSCTAIHPAQYRSYNSKRAGSNHLLIRTIFKTFPMILTFNIASIGHQTANNRQSRK